MPMIEWKEEFNLGIEQFDTHHLHMVELLNRAHDNYMEDADVDALFATLHELFEYAIGHFRIEEQYMEETNYTGFAEHLEYHKGFSTQVTVMLQDMLVVWKKLPLEMLAFVKGWLTYDILGADADYVRSSSGSPWKQCA